MMDAIKALPLWDKEELYNNLKDMILEERSRKVDEQLMRMEEIKTEVCRTMGVSAYDLKNRERQNVIVRIATANVLLRMGCSETQVGKVMGKSRPTIHYYRDVMKSWMQCPGYYKDELKVWKQIRQIYETDKRTI